MKLYEMVKELNKKKDITDDRVMGVKKYYLSLYRSNMIYLYDKGYISDPTVFDTKEIMRNILDLDIKGITGITGKIELSEPFIQYAIYRNKNDYESLEFLTLLYKVVENRNMSLNIDKMYESFGMGYGKKKKVSLSLVQSASRIYTKNKFKIDEGVLKCLDVYGVSTKFISLNEYVYERALKELGIEREENSVFVNGLTSEEEAECCEIILNGLVKLDGKYSDKLVKWLKNNKWSDNRFSAQSEGLYNWVVYVNSNEMIDEQSKVMNELLDKRYNIKTMKSNGFYVVDENKAVLYPVGVFAVETGDEDIILPDANKLEGYTGEVYSLEYLSRNELQYVGCPIVLKDANGKDKYYVDKEQTELKDNMSWFKDMGADLSFSDSFYRKGVFTEGSLEDRLYKIVGDSESGVLIGSLGTDVIGKDLSSVKKSVLNKM